MTRLFNFFSSRWGASAAWSAVTLWLPVALAVGAALASATLAYKVGRAPLLVEIAEAKTKLVTDVKAAADAQAQRLADAQAKSDRLALALSAAQERNQSLTSEIFHALKTATDGRACLRGRALSLLSAAPGIRIAPPVPESGPAAVAEGRSTASDPIAAPNAAPTEPIITDTALATWAAQVGGLYETCRLRLDALIDWHASPSSKKPTS